MALGHKINEGAAVGRCTQETEGDPSTSYGREVYAESVGEWFFQTFQRPEEIVLQFESSWIYDPVKALLLLHKSFSNRGWTLPCHKASKLRGKHRAQPVLLFPAWKAKPEVGMGFSFHLCHHKKGANSKGYKSRPLKGGRAPQLQCTLRESIIRWI